MLRITSTCALLLALISQPLFAQQQSQDQSELDEPTQYGRWGIDTSGMDRSVRPGDNFAMYAFGEWYGTNEIPPGQPALWHRMDMVRLNQERLFSVIQSSAKNPGDHNQRLISDLYNSYLNVDPIEKVGAAPLEAELAAVRNISSKAGAADMMGRSQNSFGLGFFEPILSPNPREPAQYIVALSQSGLGAGSREPYLIEGTDGPIAAYKAHAERMLELVEWPEASRFAREIVELETRIAKVSWGREDSDDLPKTMNYMTLSELEQFAPGFPWRAYLAGAGLGSAKDAIVMQKSAFPKIAEIFSTTPLETLKAWIAFHKIDQAAPYLSSRFRDARFEFWGRMEGSSSPPPRDQGAARLVDSLLTQPVAQQYVSKHFPAQSKKQLEEMVGHIKTAMAKRIRELDWLAPQTKAEALAKLSTLGVGIGYPDRWRDYSGLKLEPTDLYGNVRQAKAFNWAWQVGKLRRPVDREEWTMPPQAVGAQVSYLRNFMTFSAGTLEPPHFDPNADPAVNYGAIGYIIGHEIGHVFDNEGAQIDAWGRLRNWWAPDDAKRFRAKTDAFVEHFSAYEAFPGEPVNGRAILSETMANLTGVEVALDGYRASLGGKPAPVLDGFTGEQRYFLSFAQTLKGKATEQFQRQNYDQAPFIVTVNGVVRNVDEWYDAFGVKPRDQLYLRPTERIRIW